MMEDSHFGGWQVENVIKKERVFMVTHPDYEGRYVLKTNGGHGKESPATVLDEIAVLKRVSDHPHIITLVDYREDEMKPWHVTEYCSGGVAIDPTFKDWNADELHHNRITDQLNMILDAVGYCHSKGVSIVGDVEVFFDEDKNFIIGDLERASLWDAHHINTASDMKQLFRQLNELQSVLKRIWIQKRKQIDRQRDTQRAHENAPPSAPRRLVAE